MKFLLKLTPPFGHIIAQTEGQTQQTEKEDNDGNAKSSGADVFGIEHDQRGRCGKDSWLQPTVAADDGAGEAGAAWLPGMLPDPESGKNPENPVYAVPWDGR